MSKTKFPVIAILVLLSIVTVFTSGIALGRSNTADIPEAPRLVYPINPEVDISGDSLQFKWQHADIGIDHYEFMLYKGGGSSGEVIVEKILPFNVSSIEVPAASFESGKTYTWTLRQVGDNGLKSEKSFNTFIVTK
ncbi:MAG: hypothetical protein WC412_00500 [Candidatus Omnitrophota bacterium]|jgi:hypothetical protein